jgi:hypothetical protein
MTRTLFPDNRLDYVVDVVVNVFIDNGTLVDDHTLFRGVCLGEYEMYLPKLRERTYQSVMILMDQLLEKGVLLRVGGMGLGNASHRMSLRRQLR